ncbi:DMT family transporter [Actinokineospora soli]|uniref:DMT family transporter n=1 Tax=Actinokineospora soli TaxID=1048753 RepID=A0ABW2TL43_9PSEU
MTSSRSFLALVFAGLLWGTGGLAGALLQARTGLHPVAVAAYRLLIGGGLATAALLVLRTPVPRTAAVARRLLAAGALVGLFQAGYFAAVALTSVSLATLLTIGSVPVFVAIATAERKPRALAAIGLAVAGLALLAGAPATGDGWRTAGGIALSLATGAGFAALTLLNRRPVPGLSSGATTALGLLVGGVLLLPLALAAGMALPAGGDVLLIAAYLGIVPTALAYGAYFAGLRGAPAVTAALCSMLEPLTATVLAVVLLDDRMTAAGVVGAALLFAALVLNAVPARRRPTGPRRARVPQRSGPSRR